MVAVPTLLAGLVFILAARGSSGSELNPGLDAGLDADVGFELHQAGLPRRGNAHAGAEGAAAPGGGHLRSVHALTRDQHPRSADRDHRRGCVPERDQVDRPQQPRIQGRSAGVQGPGHASRRLSEPRPRRDRRQYGLLRAPRAGMLR